ncbi:MAG: hypothetical protein QJR05_14210, partial [Thermoanaerobacterium sp.]|nr:hypothetical protein [Thermoanaerobacterium sp.]
YAEWQYSKLGRDYASFGWAGDTPALSSYWTAYREGGSLISTYKRQSFPNAGVVWGMYEQNWNKRSTLQVEVGKKTKSGNMAEVAYTYWHQTTNYSLEFTMSYPPAITLVTSGTDTESKCPTGHYYYYY